MFIPQTINDNEILVRFVFLDNFKKKNLNIDKINTQEIFLDTRLIGVSLQRHLYTSEQQCKNFAIGIPNKQYVGFICFYVRDFFQSVRDFRQERGEFESILEFTPLDSNNQYLIDRIHSKVSDNGNPSHSDILYINPAIDLFEPTPKTSLRLFSKKLFSKCKIILDPDYDSEDYKGLRFLDL